VGPVISCAARDRIAEWVQRGVDSGASAVVDGRGVSGVDPAGAFLGPTILDGVRPEMAIAQEEVFGPVLCVIHAESLDEAIEIVNSSRFGNGTSIFTESGASVRRYRHEVQAGMVGVNIGVAAPVAFFPFSGWKDRSSATCTPTAPTPSTSTPARRPSPAVTTPAARGQTATSSSARPSALCTARWR
jgi:NAD-dependent aldehyde dehydrogenases